MELESSFARWAVAGSLQLIADPTLSTPPLALNGFHVLNPDSKGWTSVRLGPVTCDQNSLQTINLAVWGWNGLAWILLHDNVALRAMTSVPNNRGDSVVLDTSGGVYTAFCVLPRASLVIDGMYTINFAGIDTPRWPC
jgi:hypothetical protein